MQSISQPLDLFKKDEESDESSNIQRVAAQTVAPCRIHETLNYINVFAGALPNGSNFETPILSICNILERLAHGISIAATYSN